VAISIGVSNKSNIAYYDSAAGAIVLTASFQPIWFKDTVRKEGFTSREMLLKHDGGVDIEFSRDGVNVDGRLANADSRIALSNFRSRRIFLRGAGALYRLWVT